MRAVPESLTTFSPLVVALSATALIIVGCQFLTGCGNEQESFQQPRLVRTGSIAPISPTAGAPQTIIVQPGDTLHSIARRNRVAVYDLMTFNNLTSASIVPGQSLYLPPY
jgi:LysM domain-containing protein